MDIASAQFRALLPQDQLGELTRSLKCSPTLSAQQQLHNILAQLTLLYQLESMMQNQEVVLTNEDNLPETLTYSLVSSITPACEVRPQQDLINRQYDSVRRAIEAIQE
jgi:hypothetical protein